MGRGSLSALPQYEKTQIVWKKEGNNDGHVLMGFWKGWEAEMMSAERTTDTLVSVKTAFN